MTLFNISNIFIIYTVITFAIGKQTELLERNLNYWLAKRTVASTVFAYWDTFFYMLLLPIHYLFSWSTLHFDSRRIFFIHALFIRIVRFFIFQWLIFYIFKRD